MSFINSWIWYALPLALLPVIIHLINQNRHRTVKWAAMMFLLDAKKMTKGIARLRQILILSLRVLALLALIFVAGRPLASGWLALTAGKDSDTIIVLLDRSASMEQQNLETGKSKRNTALEKLSDMLTKTARGSRIVLIESSNLAVSDINDPKDLIDIPASMATDTSADIPGLLQAALDYVSIDQSGRTDIWLASDLRTTDWKPGDGRWESLRAAFSEVNGVSFYLLNYSEVSNDNLAISLDNLIRRRTPEGFELVMDLEIKSQQSSSDEPQTVPLELNINGARTVQEVTVTGDRLQLQGHTVDLGKSKPIGWGRVELPADSNQRDNTYFFVFDEAPDLKTVILSDDRVTASTIKAAAMAPVDPSRIYSAEIIETARKAEIPWDETALLFWQADLPKQGSTEAQLLEQFLSEGKTLILLPPADGFSNSSESPDFLGFKWKTDPNSHLTGDFKINWWRTDSGLLENTQNGKPLPLGATKIFKINDFTIDGEVVSFLKIEDGRTMVAEHINDYPGHLYIWATLPRSSHSTLGTEGVAFFAMIHRSLKQGGLYLSNAQQRPATGIFPGNQNWKTISQRAIDAESINAALVGGAFESGEDKWLALNRPLSEDDTRIVNEEALVGLFSGLNYRIIKDSVNNRSSLASEIWKIFLIIMALALVLEAALCLPPKSQSA